MLKKLFIVSLALIGLILLSGCTKNVSPPNNKTSKYAVHQLDVYKTFSHPEVGKNEKIHIASEGISNWTPIEKSREIATNKAKAFCTQTNTKMIVMKEHVANLPYLINHYPRVEISFVCHDMNKKIVHRSKKNTFTPNEVKRISVIKEKYRNLVFLKKLLDDGTLTQKEFNLEKKKILQEK